MVLDIAAGAVILREAGGDWASHPGDKQEDLCARAIFSVGRTPLLHEMARVLNLELPAAEM